MHDTGDDEMNGKIRSIKPEVLEDAFAAGLSDTAWRMWIASWLLADDFGRFRAHDAYLAANVWQDTTKATDGTVARAKAELADKGFWELYEVRRQEYGQNHGWFKHQKIDRPSPRCLPGPEESENHVSHPPTTRSPALASEVEGSSNSPHVRARTGGDLDGRGKEGSGYGANGSPRQTPLALPPGPTPLALPAAPSTPPENPKPKKTRSRMGLSFLPDDWQPPAKQVEELEKAGLSVESVVEDFRDYWRSQGKMMADWNATFRINVRKILTTDWLMTKHRAPPKPVVSAARKPAVPTGPAIPAPPEVGRMLQDFLGEAPSGSTRAPQATGRTEDPPVPVRRATAKAAGRDDAAPGSSEGPKAPASGV